MRITRFPGQEEGGARRGIVPTINERLARVHDAHKSSRLFVSLVRVTWRISFAPLHVLRNTYAASCYIASRTFDNLIGRDFTWIRVRVLVISWMDRCKFWVESSWVEEGIQVILIYCCIYCCSFGSFFFIKQGILLIIRQIWSYNDRSGWVEGDGFFDRVGKWCFKMQFRGKLVFDPRSR